MELSGLWEFAQASAKSSSSTHEPQVRRGHKLLRERRRGQVGLGHNSLCQKAYNGESEASTSLWCSTWRSVRRGGKKRTNKREGERIHAPICSQSYPRPGGQLPLCYLKPAQGVLTSLANEHQPGEHSLAHPHNKPTCSFAEPPGDGLVCMMWQGCGCAIAHPRQEKT